MDARREAYKALGLGLPGAKDPATLTERLEKRGFTAGSPVFIRIFKREAQLELWLQRDTGFELFETYPICYWSGKLGPKLKQGDAQSPEGFYSVSRAQLNPNSEYYRSFDLGFPNHYDRSHGRNGRYLMVHGNCVSRGCYAMTDAQMQEIWRLVTAALDAGQPRFAVHIFPFRPSQNRLDTYSHHAWHGFWRDLAPAYKSFNETRTPPVIAVCGKSYAVKAGAAGYTGDGQIKEQCFDNAGMPKI